MKKILFVLSVLTLMSYGCNRNQDAGTESKRGMQQEESRSMDSQNMNQNNQNMDETHEAMPSTSPSSDLPSGQGQGE